MEVCLRAVVASLVVAGSINACDNGAAERERQRASDREEERVRQEERDAENSAKIKSLQEQFEDEKDDVSCTRRVPAPPLEDLGGSSASTSARPRPPPAACTCKSSDPLCDCL